MQFSGLTIPRMYLQWWAPERRSTEIIRRLHGYLARPLERARAALDIGARARAETVTTLEQPVLDPC